MTYKELKPVLLSFHGYEESIEAMRLPKDGKAIKSDKDLAIGLVKAGGSHSKFSRGIIYWIKLEFQVGFMIELDTYRHGREVLSTSSSMHNELKKLAGPELAERKQLDLPEKVYIQIGTYSAQCLRKIYIERQKHRHPDWKIFCDFIETLPEFRTVIFPEFKKC